MDQIERPDHINLPIAVLDGDNPATWAPFEENRPLNMLMTSVKTAAKPRLATALMMKTCEVEIAWVLTTPSELLTNQFLYRLAGMIIDACPENASEEFYDRKLDLLRTIFTKAKGTGRELFCQRLGICRVWLVTKDSEKIKGFGLNIKSAFNSILDGVDTRIEYIEGQNPLDELLIVNQLRTYLDDVYWNLGKVMSYDRI